jgi:hypothetical protein
MPEDKSVRGVEMNDFNPILNPWPPWKPIYPWSVQNITFHEHYIFGGPANDQRTGYVCVRYKNQMIL